MRVVTAIAAALIVLLAPGTALAGGKNQSSGSQGVHVDPGSPSQHEYALPVSAARTEAAGGGHSSGPGSGSQLFGNGVTPSSGGGSSSGSHGSHPGSASAGGLSGNGTRASYSLASRSGSSGGNGGGSWVPLAAGGALVLLLGGGGGLALRRRILRT
jgi:hypothetical protein